MTLLPRGLGRCLGVLDWGREGSETSLLFFSSQFFIVLVFSFLFSHFLSSFSYFFSLLFPFFPSSYLLFPMFLSSCFHLPFPPLFVSSFSHFLLCLVIVFLFPPHLFLLFLFPLFKYCQASIFESSSMKICSSDSSRALCSYSSSYFSEFP